MNKNPRVNPFSQGELNELLPICSKHLDRLTSRENHRLEFKESFNFGSLSTYIRTAAGFANTKGGYIVYGIGKGPHTLKGVNIENFSKLDPAKLTEYLNSLFDPAIEADLHLVEIGKISLGIIYFHESKNKPVVCKKTHGDGRDLKEGEIYYRYRGRTQTIRYPELKELIDERRKHEQYLWFKHLKEIARIGVTDAALLNLKTGVLKGSVGSLLIDQSLISQISFIREGEFNETVGKPTLKLIGNLETFDGSRPNLDQRHHIIKSKGITSADIIQSFLNAEKVKNSPEYIAQVAWENSAFLPIYYFIHLAKLKIDQAIDCIDAQKSTSPAKAKAIERLRDDRSLGLKMPSRKNNKGLRKLVVREKLLAREISENITGSELTDLLDMIQTIQKSDLPISYIRKLLLGIYSRNFAIQNQQINNKIRRAICYVDLVHFKD